MNPWVIPMDTESIQAMNDKSTFTVYFRYQKTKVFELWYFIYRYCEQLAVVCSTQAVRTVASYAQFCNDRTDIIWMTNSQFQETSEERMIRYFTDLIWRPWDHFQLWHQVKWNRSQPMREDVTSVTSSLIDWTCLTCAKSMHRKRTLVTVKG